MYERARRSGPPSESRRGTHLWRETPVGLRAAARAAQEPIDVTAEVLVPNEEEGVSVVWVDHQLRVRDQLGKGLRVQNRKDGVLAATGHQRGLAQRSES